jgi:hypothetical protein
MQSGHTANAEGHGGKTKGSKFGGVRIHGSTLLSEHGGSDREGKRPAERAEDAEKAFIHR